MLLAVDVGNTNIEFGVFDGARLLGSFRLGTNREITSDEIGLNLCTFFQIAEIDRSAITAAAVASVVPQVMYSMQNAIRKYLGLPTLVVGDSLPIPIVNLYDNPREVGVDRLVVSHAGFGKYGGPLIVIDFGTATTFDAVNRQGAYLGGAIYPGAKISMEALFSRTSKLPRIELVNPGVQIGTNTPLSMQVGAYYGYVGVVKNICEHMKQSLGPDTRVVATGGLSSLFAEEPGLFDAVDRSLMLDGVCQLYFSQN